MTFEELQEQWKRQDAKLETLLRATHFTTLTTGLDRVRRAIWVELVINAAALLIIGSFIADNVRDLRYVIPALVLHGSAIVLLGACIRQLVMLREVDHAGPVVDVQRRLTRLRISRIRMTAWTLLVAPALWTPLFLVAMKGLLGIDAYAVFDRAWIAANIAFSLAFIPLMVWVAQRWGAGLSRSPLLTRFADALAGRSLNDAAAFARKLAELEG